MFSLSWGVSFVHYAVQLNSLALHPTKVGNLHHRQHLILSRRTINLSAKEVENVPAADAIKKAIFLRGFDSDLGLQQNVTTLRKKSNVSLEDYTGVFLEVVTHGNIIVKKIVVVEIQHIYIYIC
jgi:hypothetical protein